MLNPGRMRHRLAVQTVTRTTDTQSGAQTHSWATATTIWAELEPISARELLRAERTIGEVSHRVRCRYRSSITPTARFLFGARVFEIEAVMNENEQNNWLECLCREVV